MIVVGRFIFFCYGALIICQRIARRVGKDDRNYSINAMIWTTSGYLLLPTHRCDRANHSVANASIVSSSGVNHCKNMRYLSSFSFRLEL